MQKKQIISLIKRAPDGYSIPDPRLVELMKQHRKSL
jgi:hypothetical protein